MQDLQNETRELVSKSLLDQALEYTYKAQEEPRSEWSTHAITEAELALAYLDGVIKAEAVAHALKIPRNNVSAWWPSALMKGLRHGFLEILVIGTDKSYSRAT